MKIHRVKVGTYRELKRKHKLIPRGDGLPHAQALGLDVTWHAMSSEQKEGTWLSGPHEDGHITIDKILPRAEGRPQLEPMVSIAVDGTIKPITWVTPKSWRK